MESQKRLDISESEKINMRDIKYLSPSSLSKFFENRDEFYRRYLSDVLNPRPPQQDFMAVGSGFDAFVKSQLHGDIFGYQATQGSKYEFETLFEAQVEAHARDEVYRRAADIWAQYEESGAYGALRDDVAASKFAPQMEWRVMKTVGGVPMLGLPDLRYISKEEIHVITDFKVNGSTSATGASPFKGYKICRDVYGSNTNGKCHKIYNPMDHCGLEICEAYLNDVCDYWADQLGTYSWLLGEEVGSESFVVRMEQIACRPVKTRELPRCKFATHMNRIAAAYQEALLKRYQLAWRTIQSGHIFLNMSREESDEHCEMLDGAAGIPRGLFPALDRVSDNAPRYYTPAKGSK